jgi:hypothetical protein
MPNLLKNSTQKGLATAALLCASAHCLAKRVARERISWQEDGMGWKIKYSTASKNGGVSGVLQVADGQWSLSHLVGGWWCPFQIVLRF